MAVLQWDVGESLRIQLLVGCHTRPRWTWCRVGVGYGLDWRNRAGIPIRSRVGHRRPSYNLNVHLDRLSGRAMRRTRVVRPNEHLQHDGLADRDGTRLREAVGYQRFDVLIIAKSLGSTWSHLPDNRIVWR